MNDNELRRALGTALVPPEVAAVPDAGARLRARARRAGAERLALGGTVVVVLAFLVTVGVVRGLAGSAPSAPTAASPAAGHVWLHTTLTVALTKPASPSAGPCDAGPRLQCVPPPFVLDVDEVEGLAISELPERAALVLATLTATDARTLLAVTPQAAGDPLRVGIAGARYPAAIVGRVLQIRVDSPRTAATVIDQTHAFAPRPARLGAGLLNVGLELWTVTGTTPGPCRVSPIGGGILIADQDGRCIVATGPALMFGSADLRLAGPDSNSPTWRLRVGLDAAEARELRQFTGRHIGTAIAYVVSGRLVGGQPIIAGPLSTSLEIPFEDRSAAESVVSRLRP